MLIISTNISIEAFTSAVIIMSYLFSSRIPARSIPRMPAGTTILKLQICLRYLCISCIMDVSSLTVFFMIAKNFFFFMHEQLMYETCRGKYGCAHNDTSFLALSRDEFTHNVIYTFCLSIVYIDDRSCRKLKSRTERTMRVPLFWANEL